MGTTREVKKHVAAYYHSGITVVTQHETKIERVEKRKRKREEEKKRERETEIERALDYKEGRHTWGPKER